MKRFLKLPVSKTFSAYLNWWVITIVFTHPGLWSWMRKEYNKKHTISFFVFLYMVSQKNDTVSKLLLTMNHVDEEPEISQMENYQIIKLSNQLWPGFFLSHRKPSATSSSYFILLFLMTTRFLKYLPWAFRSCF